MHYMVSNFLDQTEPVQLKPVLDKTESYNCYLINVTSNRTDYGFQQISSKPDQTKLLLFNKSIRLNRTGINLS